MSHVEIGVWGRRMGEADARTAYEHSRAIYQARINAARQRAEALEEERFLIEAEQRALNRRRAGVEAELADMVLAAEDNEGLLRAKEREWKGRGEE
jgi:hypothetical protein